MSDNPQFKFELDIKSLQRSIVPVLILKVLSKSADPMAGLKIKDEVVEMLDKVHSERDGFRFELHVSVLYPMLDYLKGHKTWIKQGANSKYTITKEGILKLNEWQQITQAILSLSENDA